MTWLYQIQPTLQIDRASNAGDLTFVGVVDAKFWSENKHFDDEEIREDLVATFGEFDAVEVMEGLFQFDMTRAETVSYLDALGLDLVDEDAEQ